MFRRSSPRHCRGRQVVERLLYVDPGTGERVERESEIPFYKHQERLVFGANGSIDPKSIDDYVAVGGYCGTGQGPLRDDRRSKSWRRSRSRLCGEGAAAAFPTGRKWEEARHAPGETKYVIVNADEGDPAPTWTGASSKGILTPSSRD